VAFWTGDEITVEGLVNDLGLLPPASANTAMAEALGKLISGMRRGDERALEELYDATVGKVFALAVAILHNRQDAEEVVCATYAYAWSNVARYDVKRANPLGWLLMMCRSRALDRLRQRRASATTIDIDSIANSKADNGDPPEDMLLLLQQRGLVHAALAKLTPERRHLISLAFLQGMTHPEIASATGLALGTVKSHVRRALSQLRAALEGV
jgi:RNA polymerase sigma-70 factor (ECF subfamily)